MTLNKATTNGIADPKLAKTRRKKTPPSTKAMMGASNSKTQTKSPNSNKTKTSPKSKDSSKHRPRRRASQTYFFKYQLARNPLKAEEEDLKLALLASLQQCGNENNDLANDTDQTEPKFPNKKTLSSPSSSSSSSSSTITSASTSSSSSSTSPATPSDTSAQADVSAKTTSTANKIPASKAPATTTTTTTTSRTTKSAKKNLTRATKAHEKGSIENGGKHPYSPYAPLLKQELPDEDYLKRYKPETEDFLTFICFRTTNSTSTTISSTTVNTTATTPGISANDSHNLKNNTSIQMRLNSNGTLAKFDTQHQQPVPTQSSQLSLPPIHHLQAPHLSPNSGRRPIRQSPRLANSIKKISENEGLSQTSGTHNTAYDNSTTYEEDMKRASMALEDMAQEINSPDAIKKEIAQHTNGLAKTSPFKNNKHLVKGLMTREFAGAFADEETIFESISNHKL